MRKCKRHRWMKSPVEHYYALHFRSGKWTEYWRRPKGRYCYNCGRIDQLTAKEN